MGSVWASGGPGQATCLLQGRSSWRSEGPLAPLQIGNLGSDKDKCYEENKAGRREWILEEKGRPRGCAKAPSRIPGRGESLERRGSPSKEQKGQSQGVGRWRGARPLLSTSVGEGRIAGERGRQKRHFRLPGGEGGRRGPLLRRDMGVTSVRVVFGAAGPQDLRKGRPSLPGPGQLQRPFPMFRHPSIGHGGPSPPVLSLQGGRRLPGSRGFAGHAFLKA